MNRRKFVAWGVGTSLLPSALGQAHASHPSFLASSRQAPLARNALFPAPPFTLQLQQPTQTADTLSLSDLRGRSVLVDFWATWCGPCKIQIPILNQFARQNPSITVLGVSVDANAADVVPEYVSRHPIEYPVLYGSEALAKKYGAPGFPTLALVSPDGQLVNIHVGLIASAKQVSEIVGRYVH